MLRSVPDGLYSTRSVSQTNSPSTSCTDRLDHDSPATRAIDLISMASISQNLPHTHALGDTEEEELYHEKNGIKSIPEQRLSHDGATDGEDHSFEKDAPSPSIDYTDWDGDDDPDNPHNCTKHLPPSSLPPIVLTNFLGDRVHG
jgi:hypothetical protein